jgi:methylmalonyl-CoA mutase N-terminal domain/subunit
MTAVRPVAGAATTTDSGIDVQALYEADDVAADLTSRLGRPGEAPFTRGPYASMYRERLWTFRQYAGYGDARSTNERFRWLLAQGQTALSVAFDLPTQLGYDSDHPLAMAEVGRVGVAIDSVADMEALFADLPLDELSVNFTINATAPILLAFYVVAAERQGVDPASLSGTLQNDILKEFLARNTYIFPPRPSMRLVADSVEWASAHLPRFNPVSVTGYHAREAGADAVQELGLTMASAIAYTEELVGRGLDIDSFGPRLSFHFATTLDLFEEVAKLRAARRMWHRIATERFGAKREESARLRFFSGCSGATLTAQQPLNNVVRSTIQCLGAVLGGAQSIHVMGYDEALQIPSEEAATLALRTQQIVAHESGVTRTVDPLAGSYYVEWLTDEIERRAQEVIDEIDRVGGAVLAVEQGIPQRWIAESAYRSERAVVDGTRIKVGVNAWAGDNEEGDVAPFVPDGGASDRQVAELQRARAQRDPRAVEAALEVVRGTAAGAGNLLPGLLDAARCGATVGEITGALKAVFGEHRETSLW